MSVQIVGGWLLGRGAGVGATCRSGYGRPSVASVQAKPGCLFIAEGHDVILSNSRGPETLGDLVAELGEHSRAGTSTEAAQAADMVVVTVPLKAYRAVPVDPLAGKVVIDTNNYYPERDGQISELDDESTTTSELLQAHLPESEVVKMFNAIYFAHLGAQGRPPGSPDRRALPMAGDDDVAKSQVQGLVEELGFDVLDVGGLSEGWRFQRDTPAYVYGANVAELRVLMTEAKPYADMSDAERAANAERAAEYIRSH